MLSRLYRARERAYQRREEGATTIEFLMSFIVIALMLFLIAQVTIIFVNALLVNHALSLASQEASVRGRVDNTVRAVYLSHVPRYLQQQCNELGWGSCVDSNALPATAGNATAGSRLECSAKGQVFDVYVVYQQDLTLLNALGVGGNPTINMRRSLKVASQSLNRSSFCP